MNEWGKRCLFWREEIVCGGLVVVNKVRGMRSKAHWVLGLSDSGVESRARQEGPEGFTACVNGGLRVTAQTGCRWPDGGHSVNISTNI